MDKTSTAPSTEDIKYESVKQHPDMSWKIVFLGDANVGKSSLIKRFIQNTSDAGGPTVGAAEFRRSLYLNTVGQTINLDIWDVSGQDKFRSLTNMYFRDADACIVVYDVTDRDSLDSLKELWLKDLKEKAPENIQIAILGNKCDLKEYQKISEEEGKQLMEQSPNILLHKLVSAKKNQGINEVFQKLGEKMIQQASNSSKNQARKGSKKLKNKSSVMSSHKGSRIGEGSIINKKKRRGCNC